MGDDIDYTNRPGRELCSRTVWEYINLLFIYSRAINNPLWHFDKLLFSERVSCEASSQLGEKQARFDHASFVQFGLLYIFQCVRSYK